MSTQARWAERVVEILAGVYSFYRADLSEFQVRAWLRVLDGKRLEQISDAFDSHLTNPDSGQFLPKPADIVRALDGTRADRSSLAWAKVLTAIQRVGAYATVAFDEPAIHNALQDLGGWPTVCRTTLDDLPHLERRFHASYRAHRAAGSAHPGRLIGLIDATNGAKFGFDRPVLIGDATEAARVAETGTESGGNVPVKLAAPTLKLAGKA